MIGVLLLVCKLILIWQIHQGLSDYDEQMGTGDYYLACTILIDLRDSIDTLKRMPLTKIGSSVLVC